jgi:hypothetical protein
MRTTIHAACIVLKSPWQAVPLHSALITLLLAPAAALHAAELKLASVLADPWFCNATSPSPCGKGFEIAGADQQWKSAAARLDGDKVTISSPDISAPVAVRYAWLDLPACNLCNGANLPASPLRTDNWPAAPATQK